MKSNTSVVMLAAQIAAGHHFANERSAQAWLDSLPARDREDHLQRARLKVYSRQVKFHNQLMSQAVWDKAFARI